MYCCSIERQRAASTANELRRKQVHGEELSAVLRKIIGGVRELN